MNYEQLVASLAELSDVRYGEFSAKIVNSQVKCMGVRLPQLRTLAKRITTEEALTYPAHEWLEVDTLVGMAISGAKLPFEQKAPLLTKFAKTIENWSVCDCNTVKVPKAERQEYFDYFLSLLPSEEVFVCRYGIVNLLSNYLDERHVRLVLAALATVSTYGNYYTDMAVAWLIATAAAKCRDETFRYLQQEGRQVLNVFTYNKALQKMRDSYRISAEDKQLTYSLKR